MALHDMIQKLDFRQPGQRLVASTACIGLGALATGLDMTATPAGVLAAVMGGIGSNVLASDLHNTITRRLGRAKTVFRNHDLTCVVGRAIGLVIEQAAGLPKLAEDALLLKKLAGAAPKYWEMLAPLTATDEALAPLAEAELTKFVTVQAEEFESLTALDPRTWENFVRAMAESKGITLRPATVPRVASELHFSMPSAIREVLKHDFAADGRAYAGFQMLIWGEMLGALGELQKEVATRDDAMRQALGALLDIFDNGLNRLRADFRDVVNIEVIDTMTSIVGTLRQDVRAGFAENRELHEVTHDRLARLEDRLEDLSKTQQSPHASIEPPAASPTALPHATVEPPPQNMRFLPREDQRGEDILKIVHAKLREDQCVILHGMAGVGKTQIALEYAYKYSQGRSPHKEVYWTVAETENQFLAGLSGIATRLGLPADRPPTEILGAIHKRLESSDDWLWVIDNIDDPVEIARKYLPKARPGRVLVTTTRHEFELRGLDAGRIEITRFFDSRAGARFLAALLREGSTIDNLSAADQTACEAISQEVSGLPLALDQAAAYIEYTEGSPREYLAEYRRRGPALRDTRTPPGINDRDHLPVTRTFQMLFERVEQSNPASADLLRLCAFLAADAIPEEILILGAPEMGDPLGPSIENSLALTRMSALRARLLEANSDVRTVRVHRVVQDVLRDLMSGPERSSWAERVVRAVNHAVPEVEGFEPDSVNRFLSHLEACAKLIIHYQMRFLEAGRLLDKTGCFLRYRARFAESLRLLNEARTITELAVGSEHPATARSLNNVAILYQDQAKYADAEPMYRRALTIRESSLGPEHPDTAISLGNLAGLLQFQGKHADAEPLFRRALAIAESSLGPEHPGTATNLNNLANLLQERGKHADAEPLFRRALAIRESSLGPEHPGTATSLNNLASLLQAQGKYADAEPMNRNAWNILEQTFGAHHEKANNALKGYLFVLRMNGRRAEYRSVLSQIDPKQAEKVKRHVDMMIKVEQRRRGQ